MDWNHLQKIIPDITGTIGLTPLVRLNKVTRDVKPLICVKVEYFSPSGSLKDRIVIRMVEAAEKRGELRPGMTIIEGTSGNTGIATALVGAVKGYPVIIVMPEGMSEERKKTIQAYGAKLVLTPGSQSDIDKVIAKVREIKEQNPGQMWEVGQFSNPDNIIAHYETTGPEIWEQTAGKIDLFVAAYGTGGTLTGVARYLKERNPGIKVFTAEPAECAILAGRFKGPHPIEGVGDGFIPDVLDLEYVDGVVKVSSAEAINMARRLAREEGIFCGLSSGCNVAAAIKLAQHYPEINCIVTMINDNGLRYFSTDLCRDNKTEDNNRQKVSAHSEASSGYNSIKKDFIVI